MVSKKSEIFSALITPMHESGKLNLPALKALVRHEVAHGVEGFYCCGSSGEGLLLDTSERKAIVDTLAQEIGGKVPFIVHTGSLSTGEAIELSLHAQGSGAQAVSLIPPIYYHYSEAEVQHYYEDVANAVDLGVIVYNIPQFTGISFSKKNPLMQNPKIVGIKHTSVNLYDLERLSQAFPEKTLYNGFDEIWLFSMAAGATATIGTTVNVCPKLFIEIRKAFLAGDMPKAQALQHKVNDFIEALVAQGIFSATKYCMELQGLEIGPCKKPFDRLTDEKRTIIQSALKKIESYL
ncbi:dihydrodipicolinate synthase family protein [Sphaerochaeta sp. PS]|uniref:dihydrodipicolinate synthase family protein n=1 Tax=Sphaerochaeta sp. PS TaxID=3076336 RepID=UPI0028A412E8|nr:dihydrodipicolinate synthase family protein [Sphaerochaeta sp. PS]MDT4761709.1 dihydrodipicolinate synthase family protein [Sphaerochaeta sp. PS]